MPFTQRPNALSRIIYDCYVFFFYSVSVVFISRNYAKSFRASSKSGESSPDPFSRQTWTQITSFGIVRKIKRGRLFPFLRRFVIHSINARRISVTLKYSQSRECSSLTLDTSPFLSRSPPSPHERKRCTVMLCRICKSTPTVSNDLSTGRNSFKCTPDSISIERPRWLFKAFPVIHTALLILLTLEVLT